TPSLTVANEPVLAFTQGSPERDALEKALKDLKGRTEAIPCVVGDEEVWTSDVRYQVSPFNHGHKVAKFCYADKALLNRASEAALAARKEGDLKPVADRAQIFLKAADMLSGPRRAEVLAKTMVGQGKTVIQAEIDAAAELIDFFRFNAKFAVELEGQQPLSVPPRPNSVVSRGREGGNVVLWKPSDTAMLASSAVYRILREAGLPPNIIQFVPADGPTFGDTVTSSEHLCGINFTGSVPTFKHLWKQVAQNLDRFRTFPRLAGGKGPSPGTLPSPMGAGEGGGQRRCTLSRLWHLHPSAALYKVGSRELSTPAEDFGTFFSAVIDAKEIFGPVLTVYVYPDDKYKETLRLVDSTSSYGLTGAVFAQDKDVVQEATTMLRNFLAGDLDRLISRVFRVIGSIVGEALGSICSTGTNDKPGGPHYVLRWTSPQVIKETHEPLGDWRYSYMQ
uniref:Aldehyde dehydrogenase 4 family member A1 n=1 Tax=Panthera tigris altaica TaxID=74533 RepID=A0A8C9JEX0_PANTA